MTKRDPRIMNEKAPLSSGTAYDYTDNENAEASSSFSNLPPAYTASPSTAFTSSPILLPTPPSIPSAYAHLPLYKYHIPDAQLSLDKTTQTLYSAELSSSPAALEAFISEQIKLPPRPTVRIVARFPNQPLPLFDVQLDLFQHVAGTSGGSLSVEQGESGEGVTLGQWAYTKVKGMDEMGSGFAPLQTDEKAALFDGRPDPTKAGFWIRRFCADRGYSKKFILHRTVSNWDTEWLTTVIRQLVAGTGYRGPPIEISYPVQYSTLIIRSPHKHHAIATGLHSIFVAKTKAYEPLEVIWPYATAPLSADRDLNRKQRQCVKQTEEEWIAEWKDAIVGAIAERRRGWVGESDKVEACMMGVGRKIGPMSLV